MSSRAARSTTVDAAAATGVKVAVAVGVVVVVGAFLIGRRRGERQTTVVEIRRL